MGNIYLNSGDHETAIAFYQKSLKASRNITESHLARYCVCGSLNNLSIIYIKQGKFSEAIRCLKQVLKNVHGNLLLESAALGNLGCLYNDLGLYEKGIEFSRKALDNAEEIGDMIGKGQFTGNLGNSYKGLGEIANACKSWKEAVLILEASESPEANKFRRLIEENCES